MIRSGVILALVAAIAAGEAVQPVLLPQAELIRRLDPAQEWLFLPLAEWRRLTAASARAAPVPRAGTGLGSGQVRIACTPAGCSASAEIDATADVTAAAAVTLFSTRPERLEVLTVGGIPGMTVDDAGSLAVLLPGQGRWPLVVRWSQSAPAGADAGWSATIPLPLAGALDLSLTAPPDWELHGPGLVADGPGRWRLPTAARQAEIELRPAGSQARAWGASQALAIELPAAGAGGVFHWSLGTSEGSVPDPLRLHLPPGFTATAGGELQADGSVLLHPGRGTTVHGIVSAGAALDLPALVGARWQGGIVSLAMSAPALLPTPAGWLPVATGVLDRVDARHFAIAAPGHALVPVAMSASDGIDLRSAGAVTISSGIIRATWGLEIRSAAPLHSIAATIPAGWRVIAVDAGGAVVALPPDDEVQTQPWLLSVPLAKALPRGTAATMVVTLERPADVVVTVAAPEIAGAVRSSTRVLIVADPATEIIIQPPGGAWRLGPAVASVGGLEAVGELLATDRAPPLVLGIGARPVRVESEAACWLMPRPEDCLVRIDLRLVAAGGSLDAIGLTLPTALGNGWTVDGGATLRDDRLSWPAAWSGQRMVQLTGRVALADGRAAAVRPQLQLAGHAVSLRLSVAALAGERVDVSAKPLGRTLEADDMPRWSSPPPGARVLAAWRPADDGDAGGIVAQAPRLYDGPSGFLDRVELRSQIGPGGGCTLLSARLAAPGLAALPLVLPPGMRLEQAYIDGEAATVRRDGAGRVAVILPGRTQVQLALRFAHPAVLGDSMLPVPGIALPWLETAWPLISPGTTSCGGSCRKGGGGRTIPCK